MSIATNNRLEQLAAHHEAYIVDVRKLMLNRKACYAELNKLAQLQLDCVARLCNDNNTDGDAGQKVNAKCGSANEVTCWTTHENVLQALSLATDRLYHNLICHAERIDDYADGALLEVLPPTIG